MKINRKKYIYTGGIILLIIIITTRYLDTLYYFNKANIRYTIGDRVKIKVVAANKQAKTIDFKIIKKM